jgi:hypothetical protein
MASALDEMDSYFKPKNGTKNHQNRQPWFETNDLDTTYTQIQNAVKSNKQRFKTMKARMKEIGFKDFNLRVPSKGTIFL